MHLPGSAKRNLPRRIQTLKAIVRWPPTYTAVAKTWLKMSFGAVNFGCNLPERILKNFNWLAT